MSSQTRLIEEVAERLRALERERPGYLEEHLHDAAAIESAADEMTGTLLRRALQEQMTDELGPYYEAKGLARRWGVTRQAVSKRRISGSLLALEADDGRILFPAWQFKPGSEAHPIPIEGIAEVRAILSERNVDPLSHAIWLTARVFGHPKSPLPAYRLLTDARGAQIVRSAARAEILRLAEGTAR